MPAQKRSNDSLSEDEDDVELQRNNQNISEESEEDDVEQEEQESDDDGSPSSSSSDIDEFVDVILPEVRKDVQCPICLGIIRKTRKVMECLHRFCRECIDKSMRLGNNECPACRAHCASRRSLRDDPNFDNLIALMYPDIDKYEAEELAFHEEEKARNKQIQESIAQTSRRQLEALGKKRATAKATASAFMRRSQGSSRNLRGRKRRKSCEPQVSDNEADANNDNTGNYSSSTDEPSTEVRPKRYKRWAGGQSSNAGGDDDEAEGSRRTSGFVGGSEIPAWGRGGMRSNTRHGSQSGSAAKNAKNSHIAKIVDHLQKLHQDDDKLDIHVKLVPLDEQKEPNWQNLHICCSPAVSTTFVHQYIALEYGLQADEIELLLVNADHSEPDPSDSMDNLPAEPPVDTNPMKDKHVLLEDNQILLDLTKTSTHNLTIAYRKKSAI